MRRDLEAYPGKKRLWLPPNYFTLFFRHRPDEIAKRLANTVEALVEDLNNSTSPQILSVLGDMPVLYESGTRSPFAHRRVNWVLAVLFPLGLVVWLRVWRFRFRLARDLRQLRKALNRLDEAFAEMFPDTEPISAHAESQDGDTQSKGHDAESNTHGTFAERCPDAEPQGHDAEANGDDAAAKGYDAESKAPNFQPKSPTPQSAEDDK